MAEGEPIEPITEVIETLNPDGSPRLWTVFDVQPDIGTIATTGDTRDEALERLEEARTFRRGLSEPDQG